MTPPRPSLRDRGPLCLVAVLLTLSLLLDEGALTCSRATLRALANAPPPAQSETENDEQSSDEGDESSPSPSSHCGPQRPASLRGGHDHSNAVIRPPSPHSRPPHGAPSGAAPTCPIPLRC